MFTRNDVINIGLLLIAIAAIFYPVFYAEYLYTDEATQVWLNRQGVNLTSIPQGRYVTYKLFIALFSGIHSIHDVIYARVFSLAGWIICIPVWYYIIKDVVTKNGLPVVTVLLSCVYLVSMPPVSIYIGWAACLEIFIACTAGLISGYILYRGIKDNGNKTKISIFVMIISGILGIISLFTYQNGFGCFFIPFFVQFIVAKKFAKNIFFAIGWAFFIYGLYFCLFKYSLWITGMVASDRSTFSTNPFKKGVFLFTRPMAVSFHFTWLFSDKSNMGAIIYSIIFFFWFVVNFIKLQSKRLSEKASYFTGVVVFFSLVYLPSLVTTENYPSSRTLFALNFVVFISLAEAIFSLIKGYKLQCMTSVVIALFFFTNAWYNFHVQFLNPLTAEYSMIKKMVIQQYTTDIDTVFFIRPPENAFVKKYDIVASWDEFGVPSTAKRWTAEPLIKQIIFEKTGNRQIAEKVIVKSWDSNEAFTKSGAVITKGTFLVNVADMLKRR